MSVSTAPVPVRRDPRRPIEPQWLSESSSKLYFTRLSRDMHKLDVCVADTATGEVKPLIEERLNTYIETRPLRLVNGGQELLHWSERDGWAHYYLYDANTGQLKNRITEGEFVATGVDNVDDKLRVMYFTAAGREKGEDPYYTHLYRVGLDGSGLKLLNPGDASHSASRRGLDEVFRGQRHPYQRRAGVGAVRHVRHAGDEAGDARPRTADGRRIQISRAVHGQGR